MQLLILDLSRLVSMEKCRHEVNKNIATTRANRTVHANGQFLSHAMHWVKLKKIRFCQKCYCSKAVVMEYN